MTTRVSLAELAAADIQLRPAEAVSVVVEICRQYSSGVLRGIPSPGVIRFTSQGEVVAEGPMTTDDGDVRRAAHLLADLLPDFGAAAEYRASGGLRLVIARALGTLDLPPYATLDQFCAALGRFAVTDLALTARSLFHEWEQRQATRRPPDPVPELTISDIRRARRATGLSLDDIAAVSEVPAARLRELEWGDFRTWRADDEARLDVLKYARAAGLDEQIVLSITWPSIEEWGGSIERNPEPVALVKSGPQALVAVSTPAPPDPPPPELTSWGLAGIAAVLLALGMFSNSSWPAEDQKVVLPQTANLPAVVPPSRPAPPPPASASADAVGAAAVGADAVGADTVGADAVRADAKGARTLKAEPVAKTASRPAAARPGARPAADKRRAAPRNQSFLKRELFRIVIR
jgi:DNA-binding transcriptional regulator YiaG